MTPLHIGIAGVSGEGAAHHTPLVAAARTFGLQRRYDGLVLRSAHDP